MLTAVLRPKIRCEIAHTRALGLGSELAHSGYGSGRSMALEGKTILLVEDQLPGRKRVSEILHRQGCTVLEAHSGNDAITASQTHAGPIDLLLANCELPGMSGFELVEDLRAHRRNLPVILMSASTDGVAAAHIRGFPFIRKPFTPAALTGVIEKTLLWSKQQGDQPLKTETAGD